MPELPNFELNVKQMKLSEIHTADYNPRKSVHDLPEFYEQLYSSLLKVGYV